MIVEFLRARLDEDQAVVQLALDAEASELASVRRTLNRTRWEFPVHKQGLIFDDGENPDLIITPTRMAHEVAAKRLILDVHEQQAGAGCFVCDHECTTGGGQTYGDGSGCLTLRALVMAYAYHPDFDPAWDTTRPA